MLLDDCCGIEVLANLESFPINLEPSLRAYHEKIVDRIAKPRSTGSVVGTRDRYYIHKTHPFFVGGRIYYEVTFYRAVNRVSKSDRIIAFTDIDVTANYSANLTLQNESIEVLDQTMPITIIRDWEVSFRPCEFDNFARLLGVATKVRTNSGEYRYLMHRLTETSGSLLDLVDMPDDQYTEIRVAGTTGTSKPLIFPVLDRARRIVRAPARDQNVIRYLMLRMYNQVLKLQY